MATAVDERSSRGSRGDRVADFVAAIGERLGLAPEHLDRLVIAGRLHDIGMSTVDESILDKEGPLTADEMAEVRRHPLQGARIVGDAGFEDVALWICHHHERWDGQGYPDGLSGPEIPLESRILALADALDAMTAERPYKTAMGARMAAREIGASAATQFDPGIARIVVDLIMRGALAIAADESDLAADDEGPTLTSAPPGQEPASDGRHPASD